MQVGQKKAREMWFLAKFYSAQEADKMGLVNKVVPVSFNCFPKTFRKTQKFLGVIWSHCFFTSPQCQSNQYTLTSHFPDVDTQYMGLCQMQIFNTLSSYCHMCVLFSIFLVSDCFETSMWFKKSFGLTSLLIFILLCFTGYLYLEVLSEPRYNKDIYIACSWWTSSSSSWRRKQWYGVARFCETAPWPFASASHL